MACSDEDKAARVQALIDALYDRDNSPAIEGAFDLNAQLEYASYNAEMKEANTPELAEPENAGLRSWLTGNLADRTHRPSEVLGSDIVNPVLDAYEAYARKVAGENASLHDVEKGEAKLDVDRLAELKEDAGVYDAIEDARDLIEERFENDPARLQYGRKWLEARIENKGDKGGKEAEKFREAGNNMTRNMLMNNIRSGILNHLQLATTTYPEFGIRATERGRKAYNQAKKSGSDELDFVKGGLFYDNSSRWDRFDFFSRPEHSNQGITYFTAKLKALESGKSESAAREAGRAAVEKTQFKSRLGNEPRAYWSEQGKTKLSLLSYSMQMRRLHLQWWGDLAEGVLTKNREMIADSGKKLAYFMLANGAINGVTADIPEEVGYFMRVAFPKFYAGMRQADRLSLMGLLDMDTAELSRIPLTNVGLLTKAGVLAEKTMDLTDKAQKAMAHPGSPKTWVKAMQTAALFLPPIPIIGNKNAGALAEWAYRVSFGDYDRYTLGGKKYETNAPSETLRLIRGRGLGEGLESLDRDTHRKAY